MMSLEGRRSAPFAAFARRFRRAEEIVDVHDDAAAYARTQLPVDEDLVAEQIAEALPDSTENK